MDRRDGLGFVGGPVGVAHAHAAEPQCRDDQALVAERMRLDGIAHGEAFSDHTG